MSSIANLTVKKFDGTTDIVFTALVPSSGDKTPAVWRCESVGSAAAHKPTLRMQAQPNGAGNARWVKTEFAYPVTATNSTTGVTSVIGKVSLNASAVLPTDIPDATIREAVAQSVNLLKALLADIANGYAPT